MTSGRRRWTVLLLAGATAACTGEPAAPAVATAPAAAPAKTVQWTTCGLPAGPGALVRAVLPGGAGVPWTAVGQEGGGSAEVRPAVWSSADGCGWRRVAVRPVTPDGGRTGFVAVTRRGGSVAALGRSYSKVHGNARPTLWRAAGGGPLQEVELPRELFGGESGISVDALAATPDGLLAAGAYLIRGRVGVTLWRTSDGADWARLPPGPSQLSTAREQLLARDLVAGGGGALVVGTAFQVAGGLRDGFDAAAWHASAGSPRWRRADLAGTGLTGPGDQRLLAAAPLGSPGSGFAALGTAVAGDRLELRSALSPDGAGWSAGGPLPLPGGLPAGQRPEAALAAGPGGLVAGTATGGRAALWRSADGRAWRPEAVPGPADAATGVVLGAGPDQLVLVVRTAAGPRAYLGRPGG